MRSTNLFLLLLLLLLVGWGRHEFLLGVIWIIGWITNSLIQIIVLRLCFNEIIIVVIITNELIIVTLSQKLLQRHWTTTKQNCLRSQYWLSCDDKNSAMVVVTWAFVVKMYRWMDIVVLNYWRMMPPPFRLAASVLWCWSWEKEGRAVEVVPGI